jgi:chemotaxis protein CheD
LLQPNVGNQQKTACQSMQKSEVAYQQFEPIITIDTHTCPQVEEVRVDMAAMKVESKPVELLTSVGSCVAICLYDSIHRCGGLAHVMLPHSSLGSKEPLPSKFVDTAVPALKKAIHKITGVENHLSAKIAGGANMFPTTSANAIDIGAKNVRATREVLTQYKVRLIGEDVGGNHGRRITLNVNSGTTLVRLFNGEIKKL